jgi:hypothetical protein
VIDVSSSIELEEFEQIDAAPGTALLRVAVRVTSGTASFARSALLVDDGTRIHRLDPLPAPADPHGVLRAAYPAALELVGGRPTFALELSDGSTLDLPTPTRRRARVARPQPSLAPAAGRRDEDRAELLHERSLREEAERRGEAGANQGLRRANARADRAYAELEQVRAALREREQELEEQASPGRQPPNPLAASFPSRTWEGEGPLATASRLSRLSPRMTLGILLLILGLVVAVLILTGELKVGLKP